MSANGHTRLRIAGLVALLAVPAAIAQAAIPLALRFDGAPLTATATPDITCFSHGENRWLSCEAQPAAAPGEYTIRDLPPGKYRLHVSIDENRANPRRFPGDYEAQKTFEIGAGGPARLEIDVPRLLRLTHPGDNARPLDGMLTGCATQPRFDTPRYAWTPEARIDFGWEPLVEGAEYRYRLFTAYCGPAGTSRRLMENSTRDTGLTLDLPPLADGMYYLFRVEAWKDERLVGDLFTHDSGTHSWNYRFQVIDQSLPRWLYLAGAGGGLLGLLLLLLLRRSLGGLPPEARRARSRAMLRGALVLVIVGAAAGGGYYYYFTTQRQAEQQAHEAADAERAARNQQFIAAFTAAAPKPDWWDQVVSPYRVQSYGDLLAAWQGHARDQTGKRQFFKAAYQGILDRPDDEHIVVAAIQFLDYVVPDYPHHLGLAEFGFNRFFGYRQRTDNCANCLPGDTVQALAHNLSRHYIAARRYADAIAVNQRLITERAKDISPYKLAETWNQIARTHWHAGERERAVTVLGRALDKYRDTARGDDLVRTLEQFERESQGGLAGPSAGSARN